MDLIIKNIHLTAEFRLQGGELCSLRTDKKEYLLNDDKYWNYTSPILFPTVGKLRDGYTLIDGIKYEIPPHGIVRTRDFIVKEKKEDEITFSFHSNEETLKLYPYQFEMELNYKLDGKKIITNIVVKNADSKPLYFNLGLHPAFLLEKDFSKYKIKFEEPETNSLPTIESNGTINFENIQKEFSGLKELPLCYPDYARDALIFRGCNSNFVYLFDDHNKGIKFGFENFSTVAFWTRNAMDAPFICIEPWIGYADKHNSNHNFSEKDYLVELASKDEIVISYYFEIVD